MRPEERMDAQRLRSAGRRRRPGSTASTLASTQNSTTCGPPTFSSARLAPRPMVVKNAIISGVWSVVSNSNATQPCSRARERQRREQEAADDRGGDVVPVEHADAPPDAVADEEDDGRQGQRLHHVELQDEWS